MWEERKIDMKKNKVMFLCLIVILGLEGMYTYAATERVRLCPVGTCGQYNYSYATAESSTCSRCEIKVYDYFKCTKCGVTYAYCWNGHLK